MRQSWRQSGCERDRARVASGHNRQGAAMADSKDERVPLLRKLREKRSQRRERALEGARWQADAKRERERAGKTGRGGPQDGPAGWGGGDLGGSW